MSCISMWQSLVELHRRLAATKQGSIGWFAKMTASPFVHYWAWLRITLLATVSWFQTEIPAVRGAMRLLCATPEQHFRWSILRGCQSAYMEWAAVQSTWNWAIADYFQWTFEDLLILHRILRPRRICDIYDFFVPHINVLTYLLLPSSMGLITNTGGCIGKDMWAKLFQSSPKLSAYICAFMIKAEHHVTCNTRENYYTNKNITYRITALQNSIYVN